MGDVDVNWEKLKLQYPAVSEEDMEELKEKIVESTKKSTVPICRRKIYDSGSNNQYSTLLTIVMVISLLILLVLAILLGFKLKQCK